MMGTTNSRADAGDVVMFGQIACTIGAKDELPRQLPRRGRGRRWTRWKGGKILRFENRAHVTAAIAAYPRFGENHLRTVGALAAKAPILIRRLLAGLDGALGQRGHDEKEYDRREAICARGDANAQSGVGRSGLRLPRFDVRGSPRSQGENHPDGCESPTRASTALPELSNESYQDPVAHEKYRTQHCSQEKTSNLRQQNTQNSVLTDSRADGTTA